MKKQLRIFVLTLIGAMSINSVCAQDFTKSQMKQAKKEAKALEKEGWKVTPGSLSLYEQRLNLVAVQREMDESGMPKWVIGEGKSTGKVYNAARMQSSTVAKTDIASKIETEVAGLAEVGLANDEATLEAVSKALTASKGRFLQKIGRVRTLMECYRDTPNGNVEVLVTIAYPINEGKKKLKESLYENEETKGKLSKSLDVIMGW